MRQKIFNIAHYSIGIGFHFSFWRLAENWILVHNSRTTEGVNTYNKYDLWEKLEPTGIWHVWSTVKLSLGVINCQSITDQRAVPLSSTSPFNWARYSHVITANAVNVEMSWLPWVKKHVFEAELSRLRSWHATPNEVTFSQQSKVGEDPESERAYRHLGLLNGSVF